MNRYTTLFSGEAVDFALDAAYAANRTYNALQTNTDETREIMLNKLFDSLMDIAGVVLAPYGDYGEHYERFSAVKKAYTEHPLSTEDDIRAFTARSGYATGMATRVWNVLNKCSLTYSESTPRLSDYKPYSLDYGILSDSNFDLDAFFKEVMHNIDHWWDVTPIGLKFEQNLVAIDNLSLLSFVRIADASRLGGMRGLGKTGTKFLKEYCSTIFPPSTLDPEFFTEEKTE